jgi:GT2 family glycosyltransferase
VTPEQDPGLAATILITTRDRRDRLRASLASCAEQEGTLEILVLDDASTDGTAEMIAAEFPQVRVERSAAALGCHAQRNRGVALARAEVVVCLDDDAWFTDPSTVARTAAAFDDPRVGVVTMPYMNVRREDWVRQHDPGPGGPWTAGTFAGGASAVRRSAFLACGGYADFREHGEETDLAVRLLNRGYVVRLGAGAHVVHDEAAVRKPARAFAASSRNHVVTVWRTVPWPYLPGRLLFVAVKVVLVGLRGREPVAAAGGVVAGLGACLRGRESRTPVKPATYRLWRRLMRRGPLTMTEVVERISP